MAKISVNDEHLINGRVTVRRYKDENDNIIIEGSIATHFYIEEINTVETYRYSLTGIDVIEEIFGSDDFDIVYNFIARELQVKNNMSDLSTNEIIEIEKNIYGNEGYVLDTLLEKGVKTE